MRPEFLLAVLVAMVQDALIVVFNRSITKDQMLVTMLMTACLAALGSLSTLFLIDDDVFIYANVIGSVLGIPVGMKIPLAASGKDGPRCQCRCQSSDPS